MEDVGRGRTKVLLAQRPSEGLLGGMWEFPNARVDAMQNPARELAKVIRAGYNLRLRTKRNFPKVGVFQHAYSHFKVTVHAFDCQGIYVPKTENLKWVALNNLDDYPMGKIDRQIANAIRMNHS
jgi:A/G-specific adenine glycosylase